MARDVLHQFFKTGHFGAGIGRNYISMKEDDLRNSEGGTVMGAEFQVQKAGLGGQNWTTVCRGPETQARDIFQRQLKLYSVGRFRLLDPSGKVLEDQKATPLFSQN